MPTVWLFGLTIFTSAALLFALEPMFARMVLPLLGGTPAVWNTCMLFFQTVLLGGYAYAHFIARRLSTRSQLIVHPLVVLLPLLLLPFGVPDGWSPPAESTPVFWLLGLMTVAVGAPFFVVSATTPLLQKWFAATPHPSSSDPYFLYGASNLGSMLALLAYPILIEPTLGLSAQSRWWAWAYAGFAGMIVICAIAVWRNGREPKVDGRELDEYTNPGRAQSSTLNSQPSTLNQPRARLHWIALAFVPSSWLLGLTTFLTTDIAPVPLLWVVPLSLYLLSFILVFARRPLLKRAWMLRIFPWAMMLLAFSVLFQARWPVLLVHVFAFFVGSMVCHGELAARRPAVVHLTDFYFCLSLGGMLGGVFNALAAPLLFDRPLEYPLTVLSACLLLRGFSNAHEAHSSPAARSSRAAAPAENATGSRLGQFVMLGLFAAGVFLLRSYVEFRTSPAFFYAIIAAMPLLIIAALLELPRLFAAGIGAVLICGAYDYSFGEKVLSSERSFYGMHRVIVDEHETNWLMHGMTAHGVQKRAPLGRCVPLAYYHPSGPLGEIFAAFNGGDARRDVALVGLGSGAAICYRRPGQSFTFIEIDPVVKQLAETPEYFSYLSECGGGEYEIILGDGRLKLAEAERDQYGMIVFDAFSSDAIPVHLLTREAFSIYLDKLADGGLLAFHVTNTHLDIEPVIANLAADAGLTCLIRHDLNVSNAEMTQGKLGSSYMVAARKPADLGALAHSPAWQRAATDGDREPWRDDFSNVVGILKWFD